jgi:hypothetical protein
MLQMLERCSQVGFLALTKSENSRDVKVWPLRSTPKSPRRQRTVRPWVGSGFSSSRWCSGQAASRHDEARHHRVAATARAYRVL